MLWYISSCSMHAIIYYTHTHVTYCTPCIDTKHYELRIIPTVQMKKPKHRKLVLVAQHPTAGKWWSWDSKSGLLATKTHAFSSLPSWEVIRRTRVEMQNMEKLIGDMRNGGFERNREEDISFFPRSSFPAPTTTLPSSRSLSFIPSDNH